MGIPGLAILLDAEQAPQLLTRALQVGDALAPGARLAACATTVGAYKAGVRATVICRIGYGLEAPPGPSAVVVKVHSDEQGQRGHEALLSLAQSLQAESPLLRVPRPLAYLPDLHLSVQEHLEHDRSLKDLFHAALGETARALGGARAVLAGAQRLEEDARSEDAELRAVLERHLDDHDL